MHLNPSQRSATNPSRSYSKQQGGPIHRKTQKICYFWQAGRCIQHPCPFLHGELPNLSDKLTAKPGPIRKRKFKNNVWRNPNGSLAPISVPKPSKIPVVGAAAKKPSAGPRLNTILVVGAAAKKPSAVRVSGSHRSMDADTDSAAVTLPKQCESQEGACKDSNKVCSHFLSGKCSYGNDCRYLHAWSVGDGFTHVATLEGHQKAVTGIALPSGSNKLYTGSKDGSVRVWDCDTAKCIDIISLGGEIGCMTAEGPWVLVGIPNAVKAWNIENGADISLIGLKGQVYALVTGNDMLFAGIQDGSIAAWKSGTVGDCLEPSARLAGHRLGVVSLVVGGMKLYSGSMDRTIKVWDLVNLQCIHTLTGHTEVVMSVLCWDQYLLSCSLDKTVKVWATLENGELEVIYTHNEEHGVLSLFGMFDKEAKPILLISCNDDTVRPSDLPSFAERGKIFNREEVRAIQAGPDGLFFTGDGTGELKVWRWLTSEKVAPA